MIHDLIAQLLEGWSESVEFVVLSQDHTDDCNKLKLTLSIPSLRHHECKCPGLADRRAENRWQDPLITQLVEASYTVPQNGESSGGGGASNKPSSKIPGNLARPDEVLYRLHVVALKHLAAWDYTMAECGVRDLATERALTMLGDVADRRDDEAVALLVHDLQRVVHSARVLLGYESDMVMFADTVCECGGGLKVARTLTNDNAFVYCAGTPSEEPCGHTYPWWEWLGMLEGNDSALGLVDTVTACLHAGISPNKLYRWAHEGRVTRHGGTSKGAALWDLTELPQFKPGMQVTPPPIDKINGDDRS